jgi:hypothetical protein
MKPQVPLTVWTSRKILRRIVAVVGLLLEANEFPIDRVEILAGLAQELLQQVVHAGDHHSTRQRCDTKQEKGL